MSTKRKRTPPPPEPDRAAQHVAVRLTGEQVARVDALIPAVGAPWQRTTRSDVLRALIVAGFPIVEATVARGGRP